MAYTWSPSTGTWRPLRISSWKKSTKLLIGFLWKISEYFTKKWHQRWLPPGHRRRGIFNEFPAEINNTSHIKGSFFLLENKRIFLLRRGIETNLYRYPVTVHVELVENLTLISTIILLLRIFLWTQRIFLLRGDITASLYLYTAHVSLYECPAGINKNYYFSDSL
jgi:hypothetical protein